MASPSSRPDAPVGHRSVPELPSAGVEYSDAYIWTVWVFLAAIMLMMLGVVHTALGLVALSHNGVLAAGRAGLVIYSVAAHGGEMADAYSGS